MGIKKQNNVKKEVQCKQGVGVKFAGVLSYKIDA